MGSILLCTPALSYIKKNNPRAKITFLSFASNRELIERIRFVDSILTIETRSFANFIGDTLKVIYHLSTHEYDAVFDFEFFSKFSTLLSGLTFAPARVAFALPTFWRSALITQSIPLDKTLHVSQSFLALASGLIRDGEPPEIIPPILHEDDRQSLFNRIPIDGKFIITVNVNSGETFLERRWPAGKFAQLVSGLYLKNENSAFFFTGTTAEESYVQTVIDRTSCRKQCYNLAGMLSIAELGILLQESDLFISNDSGPLHLAASLGTPCVGLFGPESPSFYGPIGDNVKTIYKQISCSPCMNVYQAKSFRCPYNAECMRMIEVHQVESLVRELYETTL